MTKIRKSYTNEEKRAALQDVQNGTNVEDVHKSRNIPVRTLNHWINAAESGESPDNKRRGPPPRLTPDAETSIYEWIVARQMSGFPVGRQAIIRKASAVAMLIDGKGVGDGWYRRFMTRHPALTNRRSHGVSKPVMR
ncbi:hypothetical protein PR003_g6826 [Phytophthora rubi]|uniref:HTH CENPB-type domain-containing protein n=1 Tax=Phytophthora rubi TaxID=129364 RepID=A0A6A3NK97_9STRA|nr:hypothetical protein PR001_g6376 [Phytophthora rubi]KAE9347629.1 hypothetical protein PR003_g6826 [Phytophthora rubi]